MKPRKPRTNRLKELRLVNRRLWGRKDKSSSKWWSDPPKLIPVVISVIALVISCLSLWVSNRGMRINAEINRPILSLTSLQLNDTDFSTDRKILPDNMVVNSRFKNIGKSSASIKETIFEPRLMQRGDDVCSPTVSGLGTVVSEKIVLPENEAESLERIKFPLECRQLEEWNLILFVSVTYIDVGSGISYTQEFIKQIWIGPHTFNLRTIELIPTPSTTPTPSVTPTKQP